jgi:short subunit dehydrogenase-like uncharacterized protein
VFLRDSPKDKEAKEKGVMLLPGAGFDVVPSDCLASYLKLITSRCKRVSTCLLF